MREIYEMAQVIAKQNDAAGADKLLQNNGLVNTEVCLTYFLVSSSVFMYKTNTIIFYMHFLYRTFFGIYHIAIYMPQFPQICSTKFGKEYGLIS